MLLIIGSVLLTPNIWIGPHFETKAQHEHRMARYREEDARAGKLQEAYDNNFRVLRDLWVEKCPNGKDPAVLICSRGPPVYIQVTYFWSHQLEPMR